MDSASGQTLGLKRHCLGLKNINAEYEQSLRMMEEVKVFF